MARHLANTRPTRRRNLSRLRSMREHTRRTKRFHAHARRRADYAAEQPKDGDCVLVCIHIEQDFLDSIPTFHWYKSETQFKRPDGSTGKAERSEEHTSELQSRFGISYA